jgi:exopolysaccharide biosynthesis polyprenyl glycosylphosphotransferase
VAREALVSGQRRGSFRAGRTVQDAAAWASSYLRLAGAADGACALAAVLVPLIVRLQAGPHLPLRYAVLTGTFPLLWWASVALAGGYDVRVIGTGTGEYRRIISAGMGLTAVIAVVSYASRSNFARDYVVIALPCATLLDLGARHTLRKRLHRQRRRGACMRRAMAVGHAEPVARLIAELRRSTSHGLSIVAACLGGEQIPTEITGVPVCAGLERIPAAVADFGADTVIVLTCPELSGPGLRRLAWQLEETRTELCLAPALLDIAAPRITVRAAAGLPLVHVDGPGLDGLRSTIKDVSDRVIAGVGLILLAPIMAAIALAVVLSDPGPALFRQTRVGRHGRRFTLYKFRTMVVNAEELKAQLQAANQVNGVLFKIHKDPRLTRLGGWLRRWSVDELPQLLNVLRGEMSLIGPRPWTPRPYQEASGHDEAVWRRLAVKPGITGLWQVSGRADLPWEESVRLDMRYVENWSFALDLRILWRTCKVVIWRSGAY